MSQFWLTLVTYRSSQKETCPTAMLQSTMHREKYLVFAHGKVFAFFVRCLVLNPSTKSLKQLRFVFLPNPKPTKPNYILSHYLRIVLVYAAWMFLFTSCVTNKITAYRNYKQFMSSDQQKPIIVSIFVTFGSVFARFNCTCDWNMDK